MCEMNEKIKLNQLISLDTQLPTLPTGAPYLMQALASDTMNNHQIAEVISQFPSITARLLFLANSAWVSSLIPVENLDMACTRLGQTIVRSVSLSLCITSAFDPSHCKAFDLERFWCSNLLVADGVSLLFPYCQKGFGLSLKTLRTAGLLHNIGLLWMSENLTERTDIALEIANRDNSISTLSALRDTIGTDYCEVGEALGKAWAFPDVLVTILKQHANPDYNGSNGEYVALVRYATKMVSAIFKEAEEYPGISKNCYLKLNPSTLDAIFLKLAAKQNEYRKLTRLMFSVC